MMLLAPVGAGADHLKALARVARVLRTDSVVEALRRTNDPAMLYSRPDPPARSDQGRLSAASSVQRGDPVIALGEPFLDRLFAVGDEQRRAVGGNHDLVVLRRRSARPRP